MWFASLKPPGERLEAALPLAATETAGPSMRPLPASGSAWSFSPPGGLDLQLESLSWLDRLTGAPCRRLICSGRIDWAAPSYWEFLRHIRRNSPDPASYAADASLTGASAVSGSGPRSMAALQRGIGRIDSRASSVCPGSRPRRPRASEAGCRKGATCRAPIRAAVDSEEAPSSTCSFARARRPWTNFGMDCRRRSLLAAMISQASWTLPALPERTPIIPLSTYCCVYDPDGVGETLLLG